MRRRQRPERTLEEGESYYVSMTDMMVGVLFVFIIMLSFFALQYRSTTKKLIEPKDAQTAALLTIATKLTPREVTLGIDQEHRVVCIPAAALAAADAGQRCFAYSGQTAIDHITAEVAQARAAVTNFVATDLRAANIDLSANADGGALSFPADKLFIAGSATLSPNGQAVARQLADSLATRLACYGYGVPATNCSGAKMSLVNVFGQTGFDAFSAEGRKNAALMLERAVSFHQALTQARPVLAQIKSSPVDQTGSQPLLRVASYGQSGAAAPSPGSGQTISIVFQMVP